MIQVSPLCLPSGVSVPDAPAMTRIDFVKLDKFEIRCWLTTVCAVEILR